MELHFLAIRTGHGKRNQLRVTTNDFNKFVSTLSINTTHTVLTMTWKTIAQVDAIDNDEALAFEHNGAKLALFKSNDELYVADNICTHQYALLSEGYIEDGCVECPLHQGSFDLATGEAKCAPATQPIKIYPVRVAGAEVQADLP